MVRDSKKTGGVDPDQTRPKWCVEMLRLVGGRVKDRLDPNPQRNTRMGTPQSLGKACLTISGWRFGEKKRKKPVFTSRELEQGWIKFSYEENCSSRGKWKKVFFRH